MRLRAKLALTTVVLMGLILALGGLVLYVQFRSGLLETVDAGLVSRAGAIVAEGEIPEGLAALAEADEAFAQILDSRGRVLASSSGLVAPLLQRRAYRGLLPDRREVPGLEDDIEGLTSAGFYDRKVSVGDETFEARLLAVTVEGPPVIIVGASLEDQNEVLARLAALLAIGGPLALALVAGVGWVVAGSALRPVERMRSEAAAISASDISRRLPVANHGDELGRLGETLNEMLNRLETAIDRERRFVDDAAHELRTPLANLKAELELSMRRARTPEDLRTAIRSANEEAERLVRLAEDLLVLSRADGGRLPIRREESDLGGLLEETAAAFRARAADREITLTVSAPEGATARVDRDRFRQMLGNLLENALRHSPSGGRVAVELAPGDVAWSIQVADTGEGFNPAFLHRGFEPFGRSDEARSRAGGGTGLGLTIVRAIAEAHGGAVEARNRKEGGAVVTLTFPREDLIPDSRSSHARYRRVGASDREEGT